MAEGDAAAARSDKSGASRSARYLATSCALVSVQILWLVLMGRDWFCRCGFVRLWQGNMDPAENSQQVLDPYSFLHLAFGCGLYVALTAIRPHFSVARRGVYAVMSSVIWEICENVPAVIGIFGTAGSGLAYSGDSIVNSLSDTVAVILGFALASRMPAFMTVSAVLALEILTFIMIGDSLVAGLVRLMTSSMTV
jgi:hypothetical protein